ncbi:MAG: 2,3-bisphosphoglycerate-independent phosphoglycerate mutase [Oscillospiraceae bacterium]|jgi:2,3-bisphosphoglycerate-independent phosphoglycerate mutase|nr:2,3-bisphosphoglycerate-independent phosphoglycerate mutase [Oscillospiraceae bacterium]
MKYVVVIADGIADGPVDALGGLTPLESLHLPHFDALAGGYLGRVRTVPEGLPPGSDTAILSIFGNDPRRCYTGRSPLEAAGSGVTLSPGEISFRVNMTSLEGTDFAHARILSHNGGGVEGEDMDALTAALAADAGVAAAAQALGLTLHPTRSFRHVGVIEAGKAPPDAAYRLAEPHNILGQPIAPHLPQGAGAEELRAYMAASYAALRDHPLNRARAARGLPGANCLWPWGAGRATQLADFYDKYGKRAVAISAVPLVWGIAALAGMPAPRVPGATGGLDTDYAAKLAAALAALAAGADIAFLHIEAPDECAHAGDVAGKCEALRRIDARVLAPLLNALPHIDPDFRILLLSDHPTLLSTRGHDGAPVPYCIYESRRPAPPRKFSEAEASKEPLLEEGSELLALLFA